MWLKQSLGWSQCPLTPRFPQFQGGLKSGRRTLLTDERRGIWIGYEPIISVLRSGNKSRFKVQRKCQTHQFQQGSCSSLGLPKHLGNGYLHSSGRKGRKNSACYHLHDFSVCLITWGVQDTWNEMPHGNIFFYAIIKVPAQAPNSVVN